VLLRCCHCHQDIDLASNPDFVLLRNQGMVVPCGHCRKPAGSVIASHVVSSRSDGTLHLEHVRDVNLVRFRRRIPGTGDAEKEAVEKSVEPEGGRRAEEASPEESR